MKKWAVVACDQYTSEEEYWLDVEKIVGGEPSTLKIMYPEVYLEEAKDLKEKRLIQINKYMNEYEFSDEQKYQIYLAFLNDSTFGRASR